MDLEDKIVTLTNQHNKEKLKVKKAQAKATAVYKELLDAKKKMTRINNGKKIWLREEKRLKKQKEEKEAFIRNNGCAVELIDFSTFEFNITSSELYGWFMSVIPESYFNRLKDRIDKEKLLNVTFDNLSDREKIVVSLRVRNNTRPKVGILMQCTRERVRQIESSAVKKMLHPRMMWASYKDVEEG